MELPRRTRGDELLQPGELTRLRERLRIGARKHDLTTVIACAFDHRTRMLPFIFADTRMVPAGVRAIGSALVDAGFDKTRIVLQQWNRNFRPSQMRLDGRIPDLFMVSSMSLHSGALHGPDPRRASDRRRRAPADHRRRSARGLRAVGRLQRRPRAPGGRRCRRHRRGVRAAFAARGPAVDARPRRVDALRVPPRARRRGARRHPRPGLSARTRGTAFPRNSSTPASSASSAISTSCPTRCSATGCSSRPAGTRPSARGRCRPETCAGTAPSARSC